MKDLERNERLEKSLNALLMWLTLALGKREALRIKDMLEKTPEDSDVKAK